MSDKRKWNAKVKGKGTDTTGYTEDHARAAAASLGSHTLAIVDLRAHNKVVDEDGNETVQLAIDALEPVPEAMAESVRELMLSLYRQRPEVLGQETLKGTAPGPSPDDALAQVQATMPEESQAEEGTWDGDPDAPGPEFEGCDFPDCVLPSEHDGDHANADDPRTAGV